jgi:hypothetical protein
MTPTIVVGWDRNQQPYGKWGCFAVLAVKQNMPVVIKGAGFNPKEEVKITFCFEGKEYPLGTAVANDCGAFDLITKVPALTLKPVLPPKSPAPNPASVKAWIGKEPSAVWPLNVAEVLPQLP